MAAAESSAAADGSQSGGGTGPAAVVAAEVSAAGILGGLGKSYLPETAPGTAFGSNSVNTLPHLARFVCGQVTG